MRFSLVLMLSLLHPGSRAVAQRTAPPACTETAVRDSSHIWREVDAQYARLADAMRRKDVDALFALYTPDYRVVMGNGEIWSRERSLEYQRAGLARVRETHHISNTIIRLTAGGWKRGDIGEISRGSVFRGRQARRHYEAVRPRRAALRSERSLEPALVVPAH